VAHWKEGGGARGAHRRGGLAVVATPDSSLTMADFTGEVDTRQCHFAVKVAAWFTLAGVAWLRRRKRGSRSGFPVEAERDEEGERGRFGCATRRRRRWGPWRCTRSSIEGDGGAPGSDIGRRRKKRHMGCAWWTADGSAALGRPEVNNSFSDLFK
jgi:hypothetical protein